MLEPPGRGERTRIGAPPTKRPSAPHRTPASLRRKNRRIGKPLTRSSYFWLKWRPLKLEQIMNIVKKTPRLIARALDSRPSLFPPNPVSQRTNSTGLQGGPLSRSRHLRPLTSVLFSADTIH